MLTAITQLLALAAGVCQLINTEVLLSASKKLADLQNQLNEELAKGDKENDSKIESLYAQITVVIQEINNQVAIFQASKVGAPTSPTTH